MSSYILQKPILYLFPMKDCLNIHRYTSVNSHSQLKPLRQDQDLMDYVCNLTDPGSLLSHRHFKKSTLISPLN